MNHSKIHQSKWIHLILHKSPASCEKDFLIIYFYDTFISMIH